MIERNESAAQGLDWMMLQVLESEYDFTMSGLTSEETGQIEALVKLWQAIGGNAETVDQIVDQLETVKQGFVRANTRGTPTP